MSTPASKEDIEDPMRTFADRIERLVDQKLSEITLKFEGKLKSNKDVPQHTSSRIRDITKPINLTNPKELLEDHDSNVETDKAEYYNITSNKNQKDINCHITDNFSNMRRIQM